jgi:hypothetical protein
MPGTRPGMTSWLVGSLQHIGKAAELNGAESGNRLPGPDPEPQTGLTLRTQRLVSGCIRP